MHLLYSLSLREKFPSDAYARMIFTDSSRYSSAFSSVFLFWFAKVFNPKRQLPRLPFVPFLTDSFNIVRRIIVPDISILNRYGAHAPSASSLETVRAKTNFLPPAPINRFETSNASNRVRNATYVTFRKTVRRTHRTRISLIKRLQRNRIFENNNNATHNPVKITKYK